MTLSPLSGGLCPLQSTLRRGSPCPANSADRADFPAVTDSHSPFLSVSAVKAPFVAISPFSRSRSYQTSFSFPLWPHPTPGGELSSLGVYRPSCHFLPPALSQSSTPAVPFLLPSPPTPPPALTALLPSSHSAVPSLLPSSHSAVPSLLPSSRSAVPSSSFRHPTTPSLLLSSHPAVPPSITPLRHLP